MIAYSPLVSVILPTYNVAKYLEQCLRSVEKQTYRNIEVFVVVDGATDGSAEIAEKFCASHHRFNYIWQKNSGSGAARNKGVAASNGELLCFIDPDDWIDDDYIETMVKCQQEDDLDYVVVGGKTIYEDFDGNKIGEKNDIYPVGRVDGRVNLSSSFNRLFQTGMFDAPHHKLYKKNLVDKYDVFFPDLRRSQDIVFNLRYLRYVKKIGVLDYRGYNYRSFVGTRRFVTKENYVEAVSCIYEEIKQLAKELNLKESPEQVCYRFAHNLMYLTYGNREQLKSLFDVGFFGILLKYGRPASFHMRIVRLLMRLRLFFILQKYFTFVEWLKQKRM